MRMLSARFCARSNFQGNYANALFILGLSYYELGQKADAIAAFNQVAILNPGDTTAKKAVTNIKAGKNPLK